MKKILVVMLGLGLSTIAWAATYTMASGSQPACSSGPWSLSGTTYSCNGSFTLAAGDSLLPTSSITVVANAGITLSGNNTTVGSATVNVNLQTTYGDLRSNGSGNVIYGNLTASSGEIRLTNTTLNGSITTNGEVVLSGGSVSGSVSGRNGVSMSNGTAIVGSVTATNGSISLSGGSVGGLVSSTCCSVSTSNTNLNGGVNSTNNTISISGGTIAGPISSSGGSGITISNATMTSGSITATSVPIVISNSTIGSAGSTVNVTGNNTVTISGGSSVYGNVTAGSWSSALNIDSTSVVYGTCTSNSNSNTNPPAYPRCNGGPGGGAPAGLNAFETSTAANAITGFINTKVAGSGFTLALVAISGTSQMSTFTGTVKAELVANTGTPGAGYGTDKCPTSLTVLQTITSPSFTAGRTNSAVFAAVPNVYRDVRVRMSYPATGTPTIVACSADSFAIRPDKLVPLVQDADWVSAGTTRTLNALTVSGTPFHKAGQPFRLALTANNAASPAVATSNYQTTAVTVNSLSAVNLVAPAAATHPTVAGTLTPGTFSGSGTIVSTTATYSEVGGFTTVLSDRTFASIDGAAGDTAASCTGFWVCSDSFSVGRFVPDRLAVSSPSLTPTCAASGKTPFTYTAAPLGLAFTLTAQNAAGTTTQNYAGTLAKLDPTNITVNVSDGTSVWRRSATATGPSIALGAANVPVTGTATLFGYSRFTMTSASGTWTAGSVTVSATASFTRDATPEIPYADFKIGIAPKDSEGVTLATSALNLDTESPTGNDHAQLGTTAMRFGRLRLSNAFGSEKAALQMPVQAQYWSGITWVVNADDSCTTLSAANFNKVGTLTTTLSAVALVSGVGNLTLTAPTGGATGSVDIAANLGTSGNDNACLSTHGGTPASKPWLRSRNGSCATSYDTDPSARATFGIYTPESRRTVHVRELF